MVQRENRIQLHYEKYRKIIQGLILMSDALMRNVLKDIKCAEYVIQIIMEQADLKIVDVTIQQDNKNLRGRSAVLDCVAEDAGGDRYDVEVQQGSGGASPKRARYHSAVLDANTLEPGKDFDTLPKSYVIFITDEDIAGAGLPIYHVAKTVKETKEEFGDQAYIRCGMRYTLREAAQGFGDVLCQLKLTRIPRQDSQASLEYLREF